MAEFAARRIVYLRVADQAIATVNVSRTDASALVDRLGGHVDWNRRDGFKAINLAPFLLSAALV